MHNGAPKLTLISGETATGAGRVIFGAWFYFSEISKNPKRTGRKRRRRGEGEGWRFYGLWKYVALYYWLFGIRKYNLVFKKNTYGQGMVSSQFTFLQFFCQILNIINPNPAIEPTHFREKQLKFNL